MNSIKRITYSYAPGSQQVAGYAMDVSTITIEPEQGPAVVYDVSTFCRAEAFELFEQVARHGLPLPVASK